MVPGIVGISPAWIPFNFWRSSIDRILLIHGTADTVHPLCLEMDNLNKWLKQAGCPDADKPTIDGR